MTYISSLQEAITVKTCEACKGSIRDGEQRVCLACAPYRVFCSENCHRTHIASTHDHPPLRVVEGVA